MMKLNRGKLWQIVENQIHCTCCKCKNYNIFHQVESLFCMVSLIQRLACAVSVYKTTLLDFWGWLIIIHD